MELDFEGIIQEKIKILKENKDMTEFLEGMSYGYQDCLNMYRIMKALKKG